LLETNAGLSFTKAPGYPSWRILHQLLPGNFDILFAILAFEFLKSGFLIFWLFAKFKSSHISFNSLIKHILQALFLHVSPLWLCDVSHWSQYRQVLFRSSSISVFISNKINLLMTLDFFPFCFSSQTTHLWSNVTLIPVFIKQSTPF